MTSASHPYVGPRAFLSGEQLYGRGRELRDLIDLLIAERIVLLHSPSGAGKSSLLYAALAPAMQKEGFTVQPVIRAGAGIPLDDYIAAPASTELLLFDQFEEILTLDPANRVAKESFFAQLGAVLRHRTRWALFAMREEYVAAIDAYLKPVPTRLSTRFGLKLLEKPAAIQATGIRKEQSAF